MVCRAFAMRCSRNGTRSPRHVPSASATVVSSVAILSMASLSLTVGTDGQTLCFPVCRSAGGALNPIDVERVVLLQPWGATTDACGLPCPRHVRTAMLLGTAASPEAKVREQARSLPRALNPQCAAPAVCHWLRQREVVVRY